MRFQPVRGKPGRPRRRPASLYGDRGYDSDPLAGSCAGAASVRTSRDGGRRMGAGWERIAGTWSGRCRGCTTSGGCEFASLDAHGGETGNDSTILTIISLPPDVD